jgi:transposase
MFPRISKFTKKGKIYEYLVISESVHIPGKGSTTSNIANLGNIHNFKAKDINNLIDGLIKIFNLEKYSLSEDTEIIESLEHGSIIFWRKIWEELELSKIIKKQVALKNRRVKLDLEKYIEMLTISRCIDPLSKLGTSRWIERTCYKYMQGYSELPLAVNYFYRSMDQLLKIKEELELAIFNKLRNLFSINVKLTFYDITSTFFYSESCPISADGYSRDFRPDKEQIIVGVVTSWEGYPIKHFVFEGNTKDGSTVSEVVKDLKEEYAIEETTFVGDRGMITKLNLTMIEAEGFDYIMGVKLRQDEICAMLFSELCWDDFEVYNRLKVKERKVKIKDFLIWKIKQILKRSDITILAGKLNLLEEAILNLDNNTTPIYSEYKIILNEISKKIDSKLCQRVFRLVKKYSGRYEDELRYIICLNEERKVIAQRKRQAKISSLGKELDKLFSSKKVKGDRACIEKSVNKIFEGYKRKFRKYFNICPDGASYSLNQEEREQAMQLDGIFILLTSRKDLEMGKVVESYKNLKEVEQLFDDFKNFVDIRPIRHWLEDRVRAHVFICILALLLKRIFELDYLGGKAVTGVLEEISKVKLVKYKVKFSDREARHKIFPKVTTISTMQKKYFNTVGIKNPMSLEQFIW